MKVIQEIPERRKKIPELKPRAIRSSMQREQEYISEMKAWTPS
jgi:hypothetical protein